MSDRAAALHKAGIEALRAGRADEAIRNLTEVVAATPESAAAHSDLGLALMQANRVDEAAAALERALALAPMLASAALNLGNVLRLKGDGLAAVEAYRRALAIEPDFVEAHSNLALTLVNLGRPAEAAKHARRAVALRPGFAAAWENLGHALDRAGHAQEAVEAMRRVVALKPKSASAHAALARTLSAFGRLDEAAASYRAAIALNPRRASWQRSLERIAPGGEEQIARDEAALADPRTGDADRAQLGFKLGKAYEDRGDYQRAFERLSAANAIVRRGLDYDRARSEETFADVRQAFSADFFARTEGWGSVDETPIFVVGMPRSSTTLVEQILASHPDVYGAGELPILNLLAGGLAAPGARLRFGEVLASITRERVEALGNEYVRQLRAHGPQRVRFITDKLPGNFVLIGLIRLALPRAKVIHCRRDPGDTGMSMFRTPFAGSKLPYTYDLGEIGHYYRLYRQIMAHWHDVLPGFVYDIQYETLVSDQEGETRRLLAACGLAWDERCLDFTKVQRPVHTASWAQVREPMFDRSIGVAKRYGERMKPFYDALDGR
jgi:tetratricopeptide (TPR) repeat protein